jgi:hypothetical protein
MRGLLYLRDSNGEKNGEFRIEFENTPKVTINTIPTMTADAPPHTFYATDTNNCLDSSCIQ